MTVRFARFALKVFRQNDEDSVVLILLYQTTRQRKSEDRNLRNRQFNTIYNCIIFSPLFYDTMFVFDV
jgi:hypothetical protein